MKGRHDRVRAQSHLTELLDIDALDGVAYAIDPAGRIIAYGRPRWDRFAAENGAAELCEPENVIGLDLLATVQGDGVRRAYRELIAQLLRRERNGFAFSFRCDAPDVRREMRMAMTPLRAGREVTGVLFQSIVLSEGMRPPLDIFRFRGTASVLGRDSDRKIVTLCSWCQKVRADDWGSDPRWIAPEEYYRRGGEADVLVSHGICEACSDSLRHKLAEDHSRAEAASPPTNVITLRPRA